MRRIALAFVLLASCGGSREPEQHPPADVGVAPAYDATPPPSAGRTMKQVPLFGDTSIHNLLIDPSFEQGSPGIGRWYSNSGTGLNGNGPPVAALALSSSPIGMALPVAAVSDVASDGKPRSFTLLAQVPGGTGPYVVSLWLSSEKPLDAPPVDNVRVGVAAASSSSLTGLEVPLDEAQQRTVGGRTWYRYRGEVAGPFALGALVTIRFKATRARWWLQAPEVVPRGLLAPAETMALKTALSIELDAEERAAIAAFKRAPLDYGVQRPR